MHKLWKVLGMKLSAQLLDHDAPTNEEAEETGVGDEEQLTILTSAVTSTGVVREVNEDAVRVVWPHDHKELMDRGVLAVVADGMGGANAGECASSIATDLIPEIYAENGCDPPVALTRALEAANHSIYKKSRTDEKLNGMGTTCVAVALTPKQVWLAWVGDSRVYLIRDGKLFQMTEDHSLVAGMVREGLLTLEEASSHQDRHVLTKALGTHPKVDVAVWQESMPVRLGDRFLLCSDGLHDLLTENDLLALSAHGSVAEAAVELVQKAYDMGGPDNISAVLLEVGTKALETQERIAV